MDQYGKIVESVNVKFVDSRSWQLLSAVEVKNFYEIDNVMYFVHRGRLVFSGKESEGEVGAGGLLLIPSGTSCTVQYFPDDAKGEYDSFDSKQFVEKKKDYFNLANFDESPAITEVLFKTKVFDSVNFFSSLGIPVFEIEKDDDISQPLLNLALENSNKGIGFHRVINLEVERMVISIIRHIINGRRFVEQLATNVTYFKDARIIKIFNYIKENISGNLTNQVIAEVAEVSEDYVGQYFKGLTGINPQDYIEYQRMELAVNLLRTTNNSIKEVGQLVGYKDTAYFCRRFKMMFGISAGKMRKREVKTA